MTTKPSIYRDDHRFMTLAEVADYARVDRMTIRRWRERGILTGYRTVSAGKWYFLREEVESLFQPVKVERTKGGKRKRKQQQDKNEDANV